jgi:hypothetical protein
MFHRRWLPLGVVALGVVSSISACSGLLNRGSGTGQPYYGPGTGPVGSFQPIFNGQSSVSNVGSISPGPQLLNARENHTATTFPKTSNYPAGGILVVGGDDGMNSLATSEVYDANLNVWQQVDQINPSGGFMVNQLASNFQTMRTNHTAVLLSGSPKILVMGGEGAEQAGQQNPILATCFEFDPGSNSFTQVDSMLQARSENGAILTSGGKVLVCAGLVPDTTGANFGITGTTAETFDPNAPPGSQWNFVGTGITTKVTDFHFAGVLVESGSTVIICGGANVVLTTQNQLQVSNPPFPTPNTRCEVYTPAAQNGQGNGTFAPGPALPDDRVYPAGLANHNGDAILAGGLSVNAQTQAQTLLNTIDFFNHAANPPSWAPCGPMPAPPTANSAQSPDESRQLAVPIETDNGITGNILITGGVGNNGPMADACLWQAQIRAVQLNPSATPLGVIKMSEAKFSHACATLPDLRTFIIGGNNGTAVSQEVDIYSR